MIRHLTWLFVLFFAISLSAQESIWHRNGEPAWRLDRGALVRRLAEAPLERVRMEGESRVIVEMPMPDGTLGQFRMFRDASFEPVSGIRESRLQPVDPEVVYAAGSLYVGYGVEAPSQVVRLAIGGELVDAMIVGAEDGIVHVRAVEGDRFVSTVAENARLDDGDPCDDAPGLTGTTFCDLGDFEDRKQKFPFQQEGRFGEQHTFYRAVIVISHDLVRSLDPTGTIPFNQLVPQAVLQAHVNFSLSREVLMRELAVDLRAACFLLIPDEHGKTDFVAHDVLEHVRERVDDTLDPGAYDVVAFYTKIGAHFEKCPSHGGAANPWAPCAGCRPTAMIAANSQVGILDLALRKRMIHELAHTLWANHIDGKEDHFELPNSSATLMAPFPGFEWHAYFHTASLEKMHTFLGESCLRRVPRMIDPPIVTSAPSILIPRNTPFRLTGAGTTTIPQSPLTFTWEQFDRNAGRFRSRPPTANPTRTFPALATILAKKNDPLEVLPASDGVLNFRFTVRDPVGGSAFKTAQVTVSGAPFIVSIPAGLPCGPFDVTWTGATHGKSMNVKLITPKGAWWPLASNVPGANGKATVTLPGIAFDPLFIMVETTDGTFFNVAGPLPLNDRPVIAKTSDMTAFQGAPIVKNVATVSDFDQPPGTLKVNAFVRPRGCEFCIPAIDVFAANNDGVVSLTAKPQCSVAPGNYVVNAEVRDCRNVGESIDVVVTVGER